MGLWWRLLGSCIIEGVNDMELLDGFIGCIAGMWAYSFIWIGYKTHN